MISVDEAIHGRPADERRSARQARSQPVIETLEPWLRAKLETVSQKGKLAEAIRYALSRWEGLARFLDDGRIEIDSNTVERAIRPLALNRKNALFAGSDSGGEHWAGLASLVETCKLNGVEPQAYIADVLTRLVNGHPNSRLNELLPCAHVALEHRLRNFTGRGYDEQRARNREGHGPSNAIADLAVTQMDLFAW